MSHRQVVILCGPPGAGKSTAARESGMQVFDRDDPEWLGEKHFRRRIADLARDPDARAVVIRAGASSSARRKAADLVGATGVYLLTADPVELGRRVAHRNRADKTIGLASIKTWFNNFDQADSVPDFPGWPTVLGDQSSLGLTSQEW